MMLEGNFPYGMVSRGQQHNYTSMIMLQAAYRADDIKLAEKISKSVKKDLEQQIAYYATLGQMSVQELEKGIEQNSQMKYQQDRDNFMVNIPNKLRPVYDDAERGYEFLKSLQAMEQQLKSMQQNVEQALPIKSGAVTSPDSPKADSSK
jgi:dTDP-4-dehydrorhamnose reductase